MRVYSSTTVKHIGTTVTVRQQRGFINRGADDIPHAIAVAVSKSIEMIDIALRRITVENYSNRNDDIAKIHYAVFREITFRSVCKRLHNRQNYPKDHKDLEDDRIKMDTAFQTGHIASLMRDLTKIREGLADPTLTIKVNNKKRDHSDHNAPKIDEELPAYYRGLVKKINGGYGLIEIGYESFRTKLFIPRVIIHEGAHKFCNCNDGDGGYSGYWKSNYSDYLNPKGVVEGGNADSFAVFVWALAQNQINQKVPGIFNSMVESRWNE